jgi:competence protein ComEC
MIRRPLVPAALALMAGLWLGRWCPWAQVAAAALLGAVIVLVAVWVRRQPRWAFPVALMAVAAAVGVARLHGVAFPEIAPNHLAQYVNGERLQIEAEVVAPWREVRTGFGSFVIDARRIVRDEREWEYAQGRVRVWSDDVAATLLPGEVVRVNTRLHFVAGKRTPGVYDTVWSETTDRIYLNGRIHSSKNLAKIAEADSQPFALLEKLRRRVRSLAAEEPPERAALVRALVLGEKSAMPDAWLTAYRSAGIGHVLVVSGLHVSAIAGLVFFLIWAGLGQSPRLVVRVNLPALAALAAAPVAVFYTLLAGGSTSVLRACVMFLILLGAIFWGRRRDPAIAVAGAAIIVMLIYPGALWEVGFQYSFLAVIGMVHWYPLAGAAAGVGAWDDTLVRRPLWRRFRSRALRLAVFSAAAFLATVPVSLWHFGAIAPAALVGNLFAVPIYGTFVVPPLLLGAVVGLFIPAAAPPLWAIAGFAANQVTGAALLIERLTGGEWYVGRPSAIVLVLFVALFTLAPSLSRRWAQRSAMAAVLALIVVWPVTAYRQTHGGSFDVTMIDVGQGLALHVAGPNGEQMLIDGGHDERGWLTRAYLLARGIRRLDVVVATHADPDHCAGLVPVIETLKVGELWTAPPPRAPENGGPFLQLLDRARERGVPVRYLNSADPPMRLGELEVEILSPPPHPPAAWSTNDRSLTFRIRRRDRSVLVTGDLSKPAEAWLLAQGVDPSAELVQVGHHGSASSSGVAWTTAVAARHALIAAGFQNRYRFPAAEVVWNWRNTGAAIWRVDQHGTVQCRASDEAWSCQSIAPPPSNPLLQTRRLRH